MLQIGTVVFDDMQGETPLVPQLTAFARRESLLEAISLSPETVISTGVSESYPVRFASGEGHGLLTVAKRNALIALYNAANTFSVQTDMLRSVGDVVTYGDVRFDPASGPPVFAPSPVLDYWFFDLVLRFRSL